jgi:hypothetical protein
MLPTIVVCTELFCRSFAIEATPPSYIACEQKIDKVIEYVADLAKEGKFYKEYFIQEKKCVMQFG